MKNKILIAALLVVISGCNRGEQGSDRVESGFKNLFNGKDLTGWDGSPDLWSVKDGVITGQTSPEHALRQSTFLIWTNGTVADFELHCSFRLTPLNPAGFANSGIQYRSRVTDPARWVVAGYQADMEAGTNYTGILYEQDLRGFVANRGEKVVISPDGKKSVVGSVGNAAEIQAAIKRGDWNDYIVIAQGDHLVQKVNGLVTVEVTDDDQARAAKSGVLAFQLHPGPPMKAEFKDIQLKILK